MRPRISTLRTGTAVALLAFGATVSSASADEADAKRILMAMSDYLSGEQSLSFDYDSTLEIVTDDAQKLGITSSGSVALSRPNKLRATRMGGFAELEMVFDGTTFSMLGKHAGVYTQAPVSGSIDNLINVLREDYGRPLPAADLLTENPYDILMSEVTDVKDLGVGVIGGQVCDHLAFRTPDVDWQIWIAAGEQPYPCRYVITTRSMAQGPQYSVDIRDWRSGEKLDPATFTFTPPDEASGVVFKEYLGAVPELPGHYVTGDSK